MNIFIIAITIMLYILLIAWTWHSLGEIEKTKKVMVIIIGIFVMYLITTLIFAISKQGINYDNREFGIEVKNILVMVFTGVNSLIVLPFLSKLLDKIHENEIDKQGFSKAIIIMAILFLVCVWIECGYMKSTQQGILTIYTNQMSK